MTQVKTPVPPTCVGCILTSEGGLMTTRRRTLVALVVGLAVAGCGGSSSSDGGTPPATTTYTISGTVSGATAAGVTVLLSGTSSATTTTSGTGTYSFASLANGSYTITPSLAGYTFAPASSPVTVSGANVAGQNFTGSAISTSTWRLIASGYTLDLVKVWGSPPTGIWAIVYAGGLVQWSGTSWVNQPSPLGRVTGIGGIGPNSIWSAGSSYSDGKPYFRRWNGSSWTDWVWPGPGGVALNTDQDRFWAANENDIWAMAQDRRTCHWNGTQWSIANPQPFVGHTAVGMWGTASNDIWAIGVSNSSGSGAISHYNGAVWSLAANPVADDLYGIWGAGATDIWIVGAAGRILHFNGSTWSPVASPTSETLWAISGSSAANVWAVGANGTIIHWNGTAWSSTAQVTTNYLYDVWLNGPNDGWAVGRNGTTLRLTP